MREPTAIQFRLVGAAVLLAAAVIFLPWVLDGAGWEATEEGEQRPLDPPPFVAPDLPDRPAELFRPETSDAAGIAPIESGDDVRRQRVDEASAENVPETAEEPRNRAGAASSGADARSATAPPPAAGDSGWVVQVGSFRERSNATDLQQRLRAAGHAAFIEDARSTTGLYRVKVGPLRERSAADTLRRQLAQAFSVEGIVVAHPASGRR